MRILYDVESGETVPSSPYDQVPAFVPDAVAFDKAISESDSKKAIQTLNKKSIMQKLKDYVILKPLQAVGIVLAVGVFFGWQIGRKIIGGKKVKY